MDGWDRFAVGNSTGQAEDFGAALRDRPQLTSAEQYLAYREDVFLFISRKYLIRRREHRPGSMSGERMSVVKSIRGVRFEQDYRYVYSGYGDGGVYRVRLRESLSPRGYFVDRYWRGQEWSSEWITWKSASEEFNESIRRALE